METILRVENLVKNFPLKGGLFSKRLQVHAVQDVSLEIRRGETLGLVGESGCGKSTLGKCLLKLIDPTSGRIWFKDQEVTSLRASELKHLRRKMQIIFQDPYSSLNPRMTVSSIVEEPLIIHSLLKTRRKRKERVVELLKLAGLGEEVLYRYPHEFSGGQRQRVGIARALAVEPEFIVCDEPVSALDVSIQAQVINLLIDLQEKLGLTYLFISHDLEVVEHISHNVAVMYLGKIVERSSSRELYETPKHPYTRALLSAIPTADPAHKKERIVLGGELPKATHPPTGCQFHTRCFMAEKSCAVNHQRLEKIAGSDAHEVACSVVV